jgi:uncharacterized protein (TIGR02597 family)
MKFLPLFSLTAAAAAVASTLHAQTETATTEPVGFVTATITPKPADRAAAFSIVQFPMMKAAAFQGAATAGQSSGVVALAGASFTNGQFSTNSDGTPNFFIEITSGNSEGLVADVSSNTSSTVTVDPSDAAVVTSAMPANVIIRPHTKVTEIFGNGATVLLRGGANASSADQLLFGRGGSLQGIYYKTGIGAGWKITAGGANASNTVIYPGESVIVRRTTNSPLTVTNTGAVNAGRALVPVSQGAMTVATSFPVGTTLGSSGLYTGSTSTGLQGGANPNSADNVFLPDANGNLVGYYYKTGIGAGWKASAGGANASNVVVPATGGLYIVRRSVTNFNWVVAQPYTNN